MARAEVVRAAALAVAAVVTGSSAAPAQPARIETVTFHAAAVDRTMRYAVLLPPGYHDPVNAGRRYPSLYLLHGAGDHYAVWQRDLGVTPDSVDHEMIVVMPDAADAYYVDWARSDDGRADAWARYIVDDVRGDVERRYRASHERAGRAISGYGMGGYGAVVIGLRHADLFVSIGSQSGDLLYARAAAERLRLGGPAYPAPRYTPEVEAARRRERPEIAVPGFSRAVDRTPQGQPFVTDTQADAHDPFMLVMRVERNRLPFVQLDCGTGDVRADASQALAGLLLDADIAFDYRQRRGGPDAAYWTDAYAHALTLHHQVMQRALDGSAAAPGP